MTNDAEYEILPHELLANLKYDIEALKKKLTEPDTKMNELMLEMESLKDSIHDLGSIFQKALQEMKEEDSSKMLQTIVQMVDAVVSQNETIARGMIAISDKVEDFIQKQSMGSSLMQPRVAAQHSMGMPPLSGAGRMAPPPMMEMPPSMRSGNADDLDFPPPPPRIGADKKRMGGLFK